MLKSVRMLIVVLLAGVLAMLGGRGGEFFLVEIEITE